MPKGVDVAAMASKARAYREMQQRRQQQFERMEREQAAMAREHADMSAKYAEQATLIRGQMQASQEQKRENDAQIARMKEESERAAEVRARRRARFGREGKARATSVFVTRPRISPPTRSARSSGRRRPKRRARPPSSSSKSRWPRPRTRSARGSRSRWRSLSLIHI